MISSQTDYVEYSLDDSLTSDEGNKKGFFELLWQFILLIVMFVRETLFTPMMSTDWVKMSKKELRRVNKQLKRTYKRYTSSGKRSNKF